jgi:hypothetical protein
MDKRNNWHTVNPFWCTKWSSVDFIDYEVEVPLPFVAIKALCLAVDAVAGAASNYVKSINFLNSGAPVDCCTEQRHTMAIFDPFICNIVRVHLRATSFWMSDVAPVQNEDAKPSLVFPREIVCGIFCDGVVRRV